MSKKKQQIGQQINEVKSKINVLFKNKNEDMHNLKIYLKKLLEVSKRVVSDCFIILTRFSRKYKGSETNLIELEKFVTEIASEMKRYEETKFLIDNEVDSIARLREIMQMKKDIIESLMDINSNLTSKPLELKNQIEESFECLPDQMRSLNLNQSSMFSVFNGTSVSFNSTSLSGQSTSLPVLDDYFINDYEEFKAKIKPNKIQSFSSTDSHSIDHLNYPSFKSKHGIFNEILEILQSIEKFTLSERSETGQILNDLNSLEDSLKRCHEQDQLYTAKYADLINRRIETCIKWKNNKDQVSPCTHRKPF